MSNRTFACFDCRTSERVPATRITRDCRRCRRPAVHVWYKFRLPRAHDDAAWRELARQVRDVNAAMKQRALERLDVLRTRYSRILAEAPATSTKRRDATRRLALVQAQRADWRKW